MSNVNNWLDEIEVSNYIDDMFKKDTVTKDPIVQFIEDCGFEYVDKRYNGGCLWIVDNGNVLPLVHDLRSIGYDFQRAAAPKATERKPAYWWKPTFS